MIDRKDNSNYCVKGLLFGFKNFVHFDCFWEIYHLQILDKLKYGKLSDLNRIKVKFLSRKRYNLRSYNNPIALNKADFQLIFLEKK